MEEEKNVPKEGEGKEKKLEAIIAEAKRLVESKDFTEEEVVEAVEEALGLHDGEESEEDKEARQLWGM